MSTGTATKTVEWELSPDQTNVGPHKLRALSRTICIEFQYNGIDIDDIDPYKLYPLCNKYGKPLQIRPFPKNPPFKKIFIQFSTRKIAENVRNGLLTKIQCKEPNLELKCIDKIRWAKPMKSIKSFDYNYGVGLILKIDINQQHPLPIYQPFNVNTENVYNYSPNYSFPNHFHHTYHPSTTQINTCYHKKRKIDYDDERDAKRQKLEKYSLNGYRLKKNEEIRRLREKVASLERQTSRNDKQLREIRNMWKQQCSKLEEQLKYTQNKLNETQIEMQQVLCNLYCTKTTLKEIKLQNNELIISLEKIKIERDRYKLIAASLRDQMLIGTDPRRGLYESCKSWNGIERTKNVQILYEEVTDLDGDMMLTQHHEKLSKPVHKAITKFLELNINDTGYKNPIVAMKGGGVSLNDVVNKIKIKEGYRVCELIGQFGIFANMDIAKNIVLGRYIGFESTNKEWNEIYDYTNQDAKHGEYLFSFDIDENVDDEHDGSRQVTIDPIEAKMTDLKLLYINDIRENIMKPESSKKDKVLENVRFVVPKFYGWPTPMIITTKKIKKGEELLLDYGEGYSVFLKQNKRWQRMMRVSQENVSNNIIGDIQINDSYQL